MTDAALLAALLPAAPAIGFLALAFPAIVGAPPSETRTSSMAQAITGTTWLLSVALLAWVVVGGPVSRPVAVWYAVHDDPTAIDVLADVTGALLALAATTLVAIVARFSDTYLHREPGFVRFFALLLLFEAGILVVALAGSLDLLFFGWETIGLCSALLIGFFHDRAGPVANGLRAYVTYRVCDLGLLIAAALLHHHAGTSRFGTDAPAGVTTAVAALVLVGAMGKSAQAPLSGWLFRAMEGPTPSSALFYGGLSLHAGVFLLLRAAPWLDASPLAAAATVLVGAGTAVVATASARAAPDVKGSLAWAAVAQTGLMFVEIGLGWHTLALVHLLAHLGLRSWQLLRAPSVLGDARRIAGGLGARPAPSTARWTAWYALALHGFHLDALLSRFAIEPVLRLARALDALERRADRWLQPQERR